MIRSYDGQMTDGLQRLRPYIWGEVHIINKTVFYKDVKTKKQFVVGLLIQHYKIITQNQYA